MFQAVQAGVEPWIVATVLDQAASVGGGGSVAAEQPARLGIAQAEPDMGEVYGDLPRTGDPDTAAGTSAKFLWRDHKGGTNGVGDHRPDTARTVSEPARELPP